VSLLVILLIALALVTGVLGFVIEGIFWLVIIAAALFVGGLVLGWAQRRGRSSTPRSV
jgi:undecaprenyl pyrophosphate phosphatase UppP